jgi:hypothetical protein
MGRRLPFFYWSRAAASAPAVEGRDAQYTTQSLTMEGYLVKPVRPGSIKAKTLVLNGEAGSFIAPQQIADFKNEMGAAGADYQFISYPRVLHSFTNPDADKKSWEELQRFFKDIFR